MDMPIRRNTILCWSLALKVFSPARLCTAAGAAWPQALLPSTSAGAPPPARSYADASPPGSAWPQALRPSCPYKIKGMARYTLVYGIRLIPEGTLKKLDDATIALQDGSTANLTLHTIDGTIPQLRRGLDRSLD